MSNSDAKAEYGDDFNPFVPRKQLIRSSQMRGLRSNAAKAQDSPAILPKQPNKLAHAVSIESLPNNQLKPEGYYQSGSQKRLIQPDYRYKSPESMRSSPLEFESQYYQPNKYEGQSRLLNQYHAPMEKVSSRFDQANISKDHQYPRSNPLLQPHNSSKENIPVQGYPRDPAPKNQRYNPQYRRQLDENRGADYSLWSYKQQQELDEAIMQQIQYKAKKKELEQRQKELEDLKEEERIKRELLELQGAYVRQKAKDPSYRESKEKIPTEVLENRAPEPAVRLKSLRSPHEPVRKSKFSQMKPTVADENSEQTSETPKFKLNYDPNAKGSKLYDEYSWENNLGKRNPFQMNNPSDDLFRYQSYGIQSNLRPLNVHNSVSERSMFKNNDPLLNYEGPKFSKKHNESPAYFSRESPSLNKVDPLKEMSKRFLNSIDEKFSYDGPLTKAGAKLIAASGMAAPGGPLYRGYDESNKQYNSPYYNVRKSMESELFMPKDPLRGGRYL